MNRIEKIKELKKYIHSLSREKTHYKDGTTYSDIVIDGKSHAHRARVIFTGVGERPAKAHDLGAGVGQ